MAFFEYKALQASGAMADGRIEAGSRQEALQQLESRGLTPVNLAEKSAPAEAKKTASQGLFASGKIGSTALENFTRMLSNLLAAGVPLSRALVILHQDAATPAAKEKWKELHDLVVDGMSLADAMSRFPNVFPEIYVAMVRAGETGGFLDIVLSHIADFQARDKELRSKVMAALMYPTILVCLAMGVLCFLLVFFIPKFQAIFSGFGAHLPLLTRIIVGASQIVRGYGLLVVIGIGVVVYLLRDWMRSQTGKRFWENFMLKAPVLGTLTAKFAMARFCRMLGTLLQAGVPLIQGLRTASRSIGNQVLLDTVSVSIEQIQGGSQLGKGLSGCPELFSGTTLEMISVAEESGRLDQELVRLANSTESELDRRLKIAVAMAEPAMLFLIAAFIGTIFIGMVIPIFTLQDYIK